MFSNLPLSNYLKFMTSYFPRTENINLICEVARRVRTQSGYLREVVYTVRMAPRYDFDGLSEESESDTFIVSISNRASR